MNNIYLTGFMGAGKSAAGRELAKLLGFAFYETDLETVKLIGTCIADFMRRNGAQAFREKESEALTKLSRGTRTVISCGGGTLLPRENVIIARNSGKVIHINTPFYECFKRIHGDPNRPLAAGKSRKELEELYIKRLNYYTSSANFAVPGIGSPKDTAAKIAAWLAQPK